MATQLDLFAQSAHGVGEFHWMLPGWDDRFVQVQAEAAIREGRQTPPAWTWPRMQTYNGYDHEARVRGWQILTVAQRLCLVPWPRRCSICGTTVGQLQSHAEDYSRPCDARPVCQSCHRKIHRRHKEPETWRAHIEACSKFWSVPMWFLELH